MDKLKFGLNSGSTLFICHSTCTNTFTLVDSKIQKFIVQDKVNFNSQTSTIILGWWYRVNW